MVGYIYAITNKINGKQYIGKTYSTIEKRFNVHIKDSKRRKKENRPLYKAINKYGKENFYIELLEKCYNDLEEREIYWIKELKTHKNGYNATLGGEGKPYFEYSDEEVIKKYIQLKTIKETAKFFKCDIATIKKRLLDNNIETKFGNLVAKKKLSKSVRLCNDIKNNITFNSTMDAARYIKKIRNTNATLRHIAMNISRCCDKKRKTAYGFVWNWL